MYWIIYSLSVICISYSLLRKNKFYNELSIFVFVLFVTPAQIDPSNNYYAPAIWTFFFNFVFEQTISIRPLRPLALTLPLCIIVLLLYSFFKKRFF